MTSVVWRNLTLVPESELLDIQAAYDETGIARQPIKVIDDTIFVYMRSGSIIEVHPATQVQITRDFLEILDHQRLVAAYPRERVIMASFGLVEPLPFGKAT